MPEGHITAYDADTHTGRVTAENAAETFSFHRADVVDRRTGEQLRSGQHVTFAVEDGRAVRIRRPVPRGYGA